MTATKGLPASEQERDPIELFDEWYESARFCGLLLPESMALATSTPDGVPSVRMVLLKEFGQNGFVFFTNYKSRKAGELDATSKAALLFHWTALQKQVRIEGTVTKISKEDSEAYFTTRPRGSQIAAWASDQSAELPARIILEQRFRERDREYHRQSVPRPPFWGGYCLIPSHIEFWQGRSDRMHDRLSFDRDREGWHAKWLYP